LININLKQITANGGCYGFDSEFHGDNIENMNLSNILFSNNQIGFNRDHTNFTPDMWNCLNDSSGIFEYYGENFINGSANYVSLGTDFNLSSGSDAIDAGIDTGITKDIVGFTRPYNGLYDIGAYESAIVSWSNSNPVNSNPDPQSGNTSVTTTPTLRISVNDINMANQSVNTTWWSNSSGAWVEFGSKNTSGSNTTFRQTFTNATSYETNYWWSVNTSDGAGGWDNDTFSFTTQAEPPDSDPGTNYYISNDGSDSNNGTHISTPWLTIAKVTTELNGGLISAGDNIYFKRGDTWSEGTGLLLRTGGSVGNYMVIGAYGTGDKPHLTSTGGTAIISMDGSDYWKIGDLTLTGANSYGIQANTAGMTNVIIHNISASGNDIRLQRINGYKVENCSCRFMGITGTSAPSITNGLIRDCEVGVPSVPGDGLSIHQQGGGGADVGPYHVLINVTGSDANEQPFDITSGDYIYIKNCTATNGGVTTTNGGLVVGHGASNVLIEDCYIYEQHDTGDYGINFNYGEKTIARNNVIYDYGGVGVMFYTIQFYGSTDRAFYHNTVVSVGGDDQLWYNIDVNNVGDISDNQVKNNIFVSSETSSPSNFVDFQGSGVGDVDDAFTEVTHNMYWRGDGSTTGTWWRDDVNGLSDLTEWNAFSVVSDEIIDNPELADINGMVFPDSWYLNATSPCIDSADWLTETTGSGSDSNTVTVTEAGYFYPGFDTTYYNVSGDIIFVGGNHNLEVTAIDYDTNQITVNRSISWNNGDSVSLDNYYGSAPDIGAFEYEPTGNIAPTNSNPSPSNGVTGQSLNPNVQITVNDANGDTINQTFRTNATGSWVSVGWNNNTGNATVSNSTTVFTEWGTKYWWSSNLSDGVNWKNNTYYFTTDTNSSALLSNEAPSNGSINITKQPSCNITVNDPDGDSMNISFASNVSGSWVIYQTNTSQPNGTYRWDFTLANSNHTTYYWRVYVNDSYTNVSETYHFSTLNNAPTISELSPSNGSTNVAQLPTISLSANDLEGDTITVYWYENSSGTYALSQTNSSVVANSTVRWVFNEANSSNDEYFYTVNITDGIEWVNESYHLTTSIRIFDILYVDNFVKYSGNPILERTIGGWDDYGIRDIGILVNETGYLRKMNNSYQMLYAGRNYSGALVSTSIGRAYSSTLYTNMTKYSDNPIIVNDTGTTPIVRYAQECNYILMTTGEYFTIYSNNNGKLYLSNSTDGINWVNQGLVYDPTTNSTNSDTANCPHVNYIDGMWYCVYEGYTADSNFSIYMINSTDRFNWYPCNGGNPVLTGNQTWDHSVSKSEVANPKLYKINTSMFVIFYNGRNATNYWDLGVALSRDVDGEYTEWENNPILTNGAVGQWDDVRVEGPTIVMDDIGKHTLRMWYFGLPYASSFREGAIGYATCDDPYYTYPWQENPVPGNESVDVSTNPQLKIDVYDNQGDAFNIYFYTNATGNWNQIGSSNIGATNGTFVKNPVNMSNRSTIYYWSVNITDGSGFWDNQTYHFTTLGGPAVTPPNITHENPVNGSTGVSLAPTCNVTVTHPDGENSTVYFYENSTGSFVLRQTVTNVLNESVSFTFSNADEHFTIYYWRVVGFDGSNYTNETYHFTTGDNDAPLISAESPTNGSTGASRNPTLSITIADNDTDLMYVTWRTNASGSWGDIEQDDDVVNSTQTCSISNMGNYSTEYWWSVNVSDFYGNWDNATFSFTTRSAPSSPSGGGAIGGGTGVFIIVIIIAIIVLLIWR